MADMPQGPMTVVALKIDSFQGIKAAQLHPPATGMVLVRGKNGAGKSSVLNSMKATLKGGRRGTEGEEATGALPINIGAHGASVLMDLGQIVVHEHWVRESDGTAKTKGLSVKPAKGAAFKSPRAVLDNLVGHFADPVAFLKQKPEDQVRTVLHVLGLDEQLELLEACAKAHYDRRTELGRDADRLSKAEQELRLELDGIPAPQDHGSIAELTAELQSGNENNARIETLIAARTNAEVGGKAVSQTILDTEATIEELREQIVALERHLVTLADDRERFREHWKEMDGELKGLAVIDTDALVEKIHAHEEAMQFAARRDLLTQKAAEAEAARAEHAAEDAKLEGVREEIRTLLANASFPLEGMGYDQEGRFLTFEGMPFKALSHGKQLRVAAATMMAGDPPIRVLFASEGTLVDADQRWVLHEMAVERGYQFWFEVVDTNPDGVGIWIEDGEVSERYETEVAE